MNPLVMVIVGLIFAVLIAFFVVLMTPVEHHSEQLGGIFTLTYNRNLEINYSEDDIAYYAPAYFYNTSFFIQAQNFEMGPLMHYTTSSNKNVYFTISPRFVYTNSGNSKITFNISIHVYSHIRNIYVSIPAGGEYYHICSVYENILNNEILLSISIKLNNLQKGSLLVIPITVNSCTQYLPIYVT